jgi:hypothetical protein
VTRQQPSLRHGHRGPQVQRQQPRLATAGGHFLRVFQQQLQEVWRFTFILSSHVITCHHMSSHVTAAQRSFGDGWFGILGGFYRCQIRVLGDLFSMEKNRRFEGVRRCPVSVFDFFWMKESSFYVPTHQYTSYDR